MTTRAWLDPQFLGTGIGIASFPNWDSDSPPGFAGKPALGAVVDYTIYQFGMPWVIGGGLGQGTTTQMFVAEARWQLLADDLPYYAVTPTETVPLNQWLYQEFGDGTYWFWVINLGFRLTLQTPTVSRGPTLITNYVSSTEYIDLMSNSLSINFDTWGRTIPYSYGARRLEGFKIWAQGIDSSDQSIDGLAYATWADSYGYALIEGEDIYVNRIWFDGNLAWTLAGGTQITALGDLSFRFYAGSESQLPDPDIVADKGATRVPGFRGQIYVIFFDVPLAAVGNRFPSTSIEVLRTDGARINISDTLIAVGARGGITVTCSGITDQADGVVFNGLAPRTIFTTYMDQYGYRIIDGDPVRLVRKSVDPLTLDGTLAITDLATAQSDDDVVTVTRQDDNSIPNQIEITYNDKSLNYQQGQQQARRTLSPIAATTSHVISQITTDFIITATEAISICYDMLWRKWARRLALKFNAVPALGELEESDFLSVPTSQGVFTVDVTRRDVLPDNSVTVEADVLQTVRGANLFADTGSILSNAVKPNIPIPQNLLTGYENNIIVDSANSYCYAFCNDTSIPPQIGIAKFATTMPTKIAASAFINIQTLSGGYAPGPVTIKQDAIYVYALYYASPTGYNILRINKSDFTDYQVCALGTTNIHIRTDDPALPGNTSMGAQFAIAGQYLVWLSSANGLAVIDFTAEQSRTLYFMQFDLSNFTAAGYKATAVLTLTSSSGFYYTSVGACGGDGIALLALAKSADYYLTPPTATRIYRFESWSGTLTFADFSTALGRSVYANGYGYFMPPKYYHDNYVGDTGYYLQSTKWLGAKVAADLSTITTFDTRDDPTVLNTVIHDPWTDGTSLCFLANQHFYPPTTALFPFTWFNYLQPYIARRDLATLAVQPGFDLSPFMDASAYLLFEGATDANYHYIIGHNFYGTDSYGTGQLYGGQTAGYSNTTGIIVKVPKSLGTATAYPLQIVAASNDPFPGFLTTVDKDVTGNNQLATKQTGEPNHCDDPGGRSLWWQFVAPETRYYCVVCPGTLVNGIHYNVAANLAVYYGVGLTSLVPVLEIKNGIEYHDWVIDYNLTDWSHIPGGDYRIEDDNPYWGARPRPTIFAAAANTRYYIAVDGHLSTDTGQCTFSNFSFRIEPANLAPNDAFANAYPIQIGEYLIGFNNRFCTKETGEPQHAGNAGGKSMWFKFVCPRTGTYQVDVSNSNFSTLLAVYTGSQASALSQASTSAVTTTYSADDYTSWAIAST